ncbi:MAG: hypothetical protein WD358_06595 [Nitriliruptoraceae bacterium]
MRTWSARRWQAAIAGTIGFGLLLGLPTDLVPNPIFGRQIEAPWWAYPAWIVTSILVGLLVATYVREQVPASDTSGRPASSNVATVEGPAAGDAGGDGPAMTGTEKRATAGGLLALFAVGCPTCNALVVLALGANGALAFFEPVQPLLALGGIALLAHALRRRINSEAACAVPTSSDVRT